MTALTRDQILARSLGQDVHDLGNGDTVTLRGMTRGEAAELGKLDQDDNIGLEAFAIATCMVEPKLSIPEARDWMATEGTRTIQGVIDKIQALSGAAPGQTKEATKSVSRGRRNNR